MSKPAIILAYDGTRADKLRVAAYEQVLRNLRPLRWPIYIACDNHRPYRLAHAVNRCVRNHPHVDVLLIHYADVIVERNQIREAVRLAEAEPGQVFAFDQYIYMEKDGSETVIEDAPANACMAIQREEFLKIGGYDERFLGWAMEDREFNDRCAKEWAPRRVPGRLVHLWHGERREDGSALETSAEQVAANRAYYTSL